MLCISSLKPGTATLKMDGVCLTTYILEKSKGRRRTKTSDDDAWIDSEMLDRFTEGASTRAKNDTEAVNETGPQKQRERPLNGYYYTPYARAWC
jgi:hypothetical protein